MGTKKYTDIFLDFDDTLYDTRGNAIIALAELYADKALKDMGVDEQMFYKQYWKANIALWGQYSKNEITREHLIIERFRKPLFHSSPDDSILKTLLALPLSDEGKAFCLEISDRFLALCSDKPGVINGAHDLMDHLKARGYRLHICSNGFHEVQYKKLTASRLIHYFDTIVLSEDAGINKPAPAFFNYALKISGAKPDTTLMIGDNYNTDIIGAMNAGIDTMLFNRWDTTFVPPTPVNYIVNDLPSITNIL